MHTLETALARDAGVEECEICESPVEGFWAVFRPPGKKRWRCARCVSSYIQREAVHEPFLVAAAKKGKRAVQPIVPGGVPESANFRDLLDFDESLSVTVEWRQTMRDIESHTARPGE